MSKKCVESDCRKTPKYCEEHYGEIMAERRKYKNKLSNRNHLLLLLAFSSLLLLIIPYAKMDVGENAFCKQKVEAHFPEYNFEEIWLWNRNICVGEYIKLDGVVRDGLRVVDEDGEGIERRYFELTDEKDREYVSSDDGWGLLAIFALVFGGLGVWRTLNSWLC